MVFALSSCGEDSGLGSSVDTEAPVVKIEYPPSLSIIKDSFVFRGTWSDDKSLKNILVEVYRSDGEDKIREYQTYATINSDKTWSVTLNEYDAEKYASKNGWQFADGDYEIQATALDNAGHSSGISSRSFSIDNTAPVLVLTKPTTIGSNTPRSYGRTVQLEGTFSENCSSGISKLIVSFYTASGEKLFDSEFEGITDMSNANPLVIAQYYDSSEEPDPASDNYKKWENYKKLFSEDNISAYRADGSDITEQLYFSVTASDAAKVYQAATGNENISGGNVTKTFYRGTTAMLSLVNGKNSDFPNFSVASLKNYINKTDSAYLENDALKEIVESAASISTNTSETETIADFIANTSTTASDGSSLDVYLTFSLNPRNNPAYTISGLALKPDTTDTDNYTGAYYNYYSDSTINVSIAPGLDLTNILTNSVTVYYTKEGTSEKQLLWTWNEAKAIEFAMKNYALSEEQAKTALSADPATYRYTPTDADANTDTLSKSTTLSAAKGEIGYGYKYDFSIEGTDIDNPNDTQKIIPSDTAGFGFYAKANVAAPVVNLGDENKANFTNLLTLSSITESVVTEGKLSFSGVTTSASEVSRMSYKITLTDTSDSEKTAVTASDIPFTLQENTQYSYDWNFSFVPTDEMKSVIMSGLYTISVEITASNGEDGKASRTYYLDNVAPSISSVLISTGYTKNGIIYINNTNKFTLSGTTTDNYLLNSTNFVFAGKDSEGNDATVSDTVSNISWSKENIDLSGFKVQSSESDVLLTVTATDGAGNSNSETYKVKFDTTPPKGLHALDGKSKDVYFRIGEADNDDITSSDSLLADALDTDVGGKYSSGTWGNTQTIKIRGNFEDAGSGVRMIYYKVFDSEPADTEISDYLKNYGTNSTGYFAPLADDKIKTRRVFYTGISENEANEATKGIIGVDADGNVISDSENPDSAQVKVVKEGNVGSKYYAPIVSNYESTITGLNIGSNYIVLVAVDNVGNAAIDAVSVLESTTTTATHNDFSLNVDNEAPTLTSTRSGAHYTNTVKPIAVEGSFDDNASKVKSVSLTVNGTTIASNLDSDNKKWNTTIPLKVLSKFEDGKVYNVNASVTDNAGNSAASTIFTLQVDKEAPKIRMTSPTVGTADLNGTISVSGSVPAANIGATPEKLELYYTTTEPSSSTTIENLTQIGSAIDDVTQIYSWSFSDFDTEIVFTSDESARVTKDIYIVPVVYDEAGNCNIYTESSDGTKTYSFTEGNGTVSNTGNYFKYTIDRNKDRPIIQITSIESLGENAWLGNATIRGTLTDDDGITSFSISQNGSDWTAVPVSNGSWTYAITGGDAANILLKFKVVDAVGKTFTTGDESQFGRPYYLLANTQANEIATGDYGLDNNAALSVNLDTAAPKVETRGLAIGSNTGDYASDTNSQGLYTLAQIKAEPTSAQYIPGASRYAGGSSKYVRFFVPVNESNISKVAVKILDSDSNAETSHYFKVTVADDGTISEEAITDDEIELSATAQAITVSEISYTYYESAIIRIPSQNVVSENGEQVEKTSGAKTISVSVTDKAGNETTKSDTFSIDNFGPAQITITSPASTDEVTGTVNVVGTASDAGVGISSIEWLVPPATYTESMTDSALSALEGWTNSNNTKTTSVFNFRFTAGSTTDLTEYDKTEKYKVTHNAATNIYTIPLFIKTMDTLGNVYIKRDYAITHNPDADRPVTEFSYPTANDYESGNDYITLSGVIRASGTVAIPSGTTNVGQVYIQIGTVAANGDVTWSKDNAILSNEFAALGGVKTKEQIVSEYNLSTVEDEDITKKFYIADGWWGIPVTTKTSTWNVSLNAKGNLDPSGDSTNNIAIRACAINADGKMGLWTDTTIAPVYIHVDNGAPSQSAVMRQYNSFASSAVESNIKVQKDYTAEMYLKGTWYLVVTLMDTESVNPDSITVRRGSAMQAYESSIIKWTYSDNSTSTGEKPTTGKTVTKSEKVIYIPIETESMASSNVSYTVYVEDGSTPAHSSTMTYTFYIDNTPPTLSAINANGTELSTESENSVQDSEYKFTIDGSVTDTGSGYERLMFYYMRNGKISGTDTEFTNEYILDPLVTTGNADATVPESSKIPLAGLAEITIDGSAKVWAKAATGTVTANSDDTFTFTDTSSVVSGNAHIHKGSLIYIAGDFGVITNVSESNVTFKMNAIITGNETSASFPYAQVVDNTVAETSSNDTANPFTIDGDDGDGMIEKVKTSGAKTDWNAAIHSTNIPDGPAYLVVIAMDAAGNASTVTYPVDVINNAPRLAKLYLGTDLNSNGTFATSEFSQYNVFTVNTTAGITTSGYKSNATIETKKFEAGQFTAKDKLAVLPEITGGNKAVHLVYKRGASSDEKVTGSGASLLDARATKKAASDDETVSELSTAISITSGNKWDASLAARKGDSLYAFELSNDQVWQGLTADPTGAVGVSFTFWDETEERTIGTDSQYCVAYVSDLLINLSDSTEPTIAIDPFYWKSLTDNSIYGSESAKSTADLNGHIELESDWAKSGNKSGTAGEYDADPKVSGKIKITGTASDNKMLYAIALKIDGFTLDGMTAGNSFTFATFDKTSWTLGKGKTSNTAGGDIAQDGWQFVLDTENSTLNQSGHTINWTLYLDTEKHDTVAANDVNITATATDYASLTKKGSNNSANGTPYQMDVVPYVTGITRNSKYNTNRARSGAVPLLRGEAENTVTGFNLGKASGSIIAITLNTKADGTGTSYPMTSPAVVTAGSKLSFTMPAEAKDGYLTVSIDSIKTLNNLNKDSVEYNKENTQNVSSTDYWTDTRYVRVWQSNTGDYFVGSTLPIYPSMAMGSNGTLYASWSNYSKSDVYYAAITSQTATQVYHGYDPPEETDISVAGEDKVNVFYSANYHGGNSYNWTSNSTSAGGLYAWDTNAPAIDCSRQYNNAFRFELFYHNQQLQQFKNLKIKRTSSNNNGIIHVAYYDTVTKSVHYSEIGGNYSPQDNRTNYHELSWVNIDGKTDSQDENYPVTLSSQRQTYQTSDGSESYYLYFDGYNYSLATSQFEDTSRTAATGESLSLALTNSNYPVIVYYDADNSVLKLARATSTTPKGSATLWKVQEVLGTSDVNYGTMVDYIACGIDSSGVLHIVFQNTKGELCYIKSTNTSANGSTKYTFGSSVVIAESATNIDLTMHGTVPYISYLTRINSFDGMNIAYYDKTLDLDCDGTAEGGWETMTAPLNYKVSNGKSCIEAHPTPASATWEAAVGFTPGDLYRVAYYIGNGSGH